jgi:hypothetical protein
VLYIAIVRPFEKKSTNLMEVTNEMTYFFITSYVVP